MNGIVPGPLWLAIASSVNSAPTENGTPTYPSEGAAVNRKMAESEEHLTDRGRTGHADCEGALHSQKHQRKGQGG